MRRVFLSMFSCIPGSPSIRLTLHHLHEPSEEIPRVVRPRRRLRVVLDRERRLPLHRKALARPVVQVDVRDLRLPPRDSTSTANPWFCAVISTFPVVRSLTG